MATPRRRPGKKLIVDIKAIRTATGLSQMEFANAYGLAVASLRNWEQGTREPEHPIALYLYMIGRYPGLVREEIRRLNLEKS